MEVSEQKSKYLHSKLPITQNEKVLAIYRHHWFAYVSTWIFGGFIVVVVMALAIAATMFGGDSVANYRMQIIGGAAAFSVLILLGTGLPVYLRSQEQLVLTEQALLQMLRPSLFASKVDQVSLTRIDDITVRQDFLGTVLGYGHITVETPGEEDNYEFLMLPQPHQAAREISEAHENYDAALQSGRLQTTLGTQPTVPPADAPQIDPAQYQQFLAYQQAQAASQRAFPTATPDQQLPQSPVPQQPTYPPAEAASQQSAANPSDQV